MSRAWKDGHIAPSVSLCCAMILLVSIKYLSYLKVPSCKARLVLLHAILTHLWDVCQGTGLAGSPAPRLWKRWRGGRKAGSMNEKELSHYVKSTHCSERSDLAG